MAQYRALSQQTRETPTCGADTSEDPALAILHRDAVVFMVLPQDPNTPAPNRRVDPS